MRSFTRIATVLAIVLVFLAVDSIAQAQDRGRGRRGGGGGFGGGFGGSRGAGVEAGSLLRSEQVQAELKLSEDQLAEISALTEKAREQVRESFRGFRDLSDDERRAKGEELRSKQQELQADMRKQLEKVLSAEQVKRLDEISLQVRGMRALADSAIRSKLSITEEQKQGIDDIVQAQRDMMRELFGGMRELRDLDNDERAAKFAELREKGEELASETEAAVLELLTEEQRRSFAEMKGKPFELDRRSLFGGGRGGRGGESGQRERGRPDRGGDGEGGRGANRPQRPQPI